MRKFIISDIHGNGKLYDEIINYLENISLETPVTLYINGDLIDRGEDSGEILLDVIKRINNPRSFFKIVYLGGNHELMMYNIYQKRLNDKNIFLNNWYFNGGRVTDNYLNKVLDSKDKIEEVVNFISNLKIYHKFIEKIDNKNILLVHAASPFNVKDECDLKIKDNNKKVNYSVWAREDTSSLFKNRIGNKNYFTIIGHTPNDNRNGYVYNKNGNYLNIDGGGAGYVIGMESYEHFPLVEVEDNYLRILTFNNKNEIISANYFVSNQSIPFTEKEILKERKRLIKK